MERRPTPVPDLQTFSRPKSFILQRNLTAETPRELIEAMSLLPRNHFPFPHLECHINAEIPGIVSGLWRSIGSSSEQLMRNPCPSRIQMILLSKQPKAPKQPHSRLSGERGADLSIPPRVANLPLSRISGEVYRSPRGSLDKICSQSCVTITQLPLRWHFLLSESVDLQ